MRKPFKWLLWLIPLANPWGASDSTMELGRSLQRAKDSKKRKERNDIWIFFCHVTCLLQWQFKWTRYSVYGFSFYISFKFSGALRLKLIVSIIIKVWWIRWSKMYTGSFTVQCADSQIIPNKCWNCNLRQHTAQKKIISARCAHYCEYENVILHF